MLLQGVARADVARFGAKVDHRGRLALFASKWNALAFWCGTLMVSVGVLLHLPMYWMGRHMHFRLSGMPMDNGMLVGMGLIIGGFVAAGFGLRPPRPTHSAMAGAVIPSENTPLTRAHWLQLGILAVAFIIDVMKASSLGFVVPGMAEEYGLSRAAVSVLPFIALIGTTIGSFIWGALADFYGRRASILLAAVMFVGTSICGTMPSFNWNIFMCFVMGLAAGGMLPVANALLAEIMPARHRGWALVLIGGIGTVGGYFATSVASALLQPVFSWRVMWLISFPTGLLLVALSPLLPESARYLLQMGRIDEARETFARFGTVITAGPEIAPTSDRALPASRSMKESLSSPGLFGTSVALTLAALAWGFVNYGVLLWLPTTLAAEGRSVAAVSGIIASSALIAIPTVLVATWLYGIWSTKRALIVAIGVTTLGLLALLLRQSLPILSNPIISVSLIIIGASAVVSFIIPYAAENFPLRLRGRATGWVAGCSKAGGVFAQGLAAMALVPSLGIAAGLIAVPAVLSLMMVAAFGQETHGVDLGSLETATT
jgi:putative MFS transporter